jgi:hypothetical protein
MALLFGDVPIHLPSKKADSRSESTQGKLKTPHTNKLERRTRSAVTRDQRFKPQVAPYFHCDGALPDSEMGNLEIKTRLQYEN